MAYNGNVEIISGLKPKNGGNFPLIDAAHVYVSDELNLNQVLAGIEEAGTNIKDYIDSKTEGITEDAETFSSRIATLEDTVEDTAEVRGIVSMEDDPNYQFIFKDNNGGVMFCIDSNGNGQFPSGVYAPNIDSLASMVGAVPVKDQIKDAVRREASARGDDVFAISKRCNAIESDITSLKNATYRISGTWAQKTETVTDEVTGTTTSRTVSDLNNMYLSTPNAINFATVHSATSDTDTNYITFNRDVRTPAGSFATVADKVEFLLSKTGHTYTANWH